MSFIIFYEKPGCKTNAKQKKYFRDAGYRVIERNILEHGMNHSDLYKFVKKIPIREWFNKNAPQIKNKEINPRGMNRREALELLINDAILIKRPLLSINGKKLCGFNKGLIEELV